MEASLILIGIIGGVLCGATLVGGAVILYLFWQSNQKVRELRDSLRSSTDRKSLEVLPTMASPAASSPPPPPLPAYKQNWNLQASIDALPPDPDAGSVWLDGIAGVIAGQRFLIHQDEMLLGRSGVCDIQFHDPKVSRQHALLRFYNDEYWIQDMQSSRGTIINGRRIQSHLLKNKDQVRLGDSVVIFRRN